MTLKTKLLSLLMFLRTLKHKQKEVNTQLEEALLDLQRVLKEHT